MRRFRIFPLLEFYPPRPGATSTREETCPFRRPPSNSARGRCPPVTRSVTVHPHDRYQRSGCGTNSWVSPPARRRQHGSDPEVVFEVLVEAGRRLLGQSGTGIGERAQKVVGAGRHTGSRIFPRNPRTVPTGHRARPASYASAAHSAPLDTRIGRCVDVRGQNRTRVVTQGDNGSGCGHNEPVDRAIGRWRGGPTTKIHLACDGYGRPLTLLRIAGNVTDCTMFRRPRHHCARAEPYKAGHLPARHGHVPIRRWSLRTPIPTVPIPSPWPSG